MVINLEGKTKEDLLEIIKTGDPNPTNKKKWNIIRPYAANQYFQALAKKYGDLSFDLYEKAFDLMSKTIDAVLNNKEVEVAELPYTDFYGELFLGEVVNLAVPAKLSGSQSMNWSLYAEACVKLVYGKY